MIIPSLITGWAEKFFPGLLCQVKGKPGVIFLTFDDGPTPDLTTEILRLLEEFHAIATFFCLGRQADQHPELVHEIKKKGHSLGNHSWSHPDGWFTKTSRYSEDIQKAGNIIHTRLLRPPYGRIRPWQIRRLQLKYRIVLWRIMIPDYRAGINADKALKKLQRHVCAGDIVVMHDNEKARDNILRLLPPFLKYFTGKGYSFEAIPMERE